jgi:aspartate/methionine/tyrosine aminotransferase
MQRVARYSEFAWAPMSGLQIGATAWCFRDATGRAGVKAFFQQQVERLSETLTRIGFRCYPAKAGIYVLCESPSAINGRAVSSAEQAAVELLEQFDLAVVPWDASANQYLRFTSMYRDEDLAKLQELGNSLEVG